MAGGDPAAGHIFKQARKAFLIRWKRRRPQRVSLPVRQKPREEEDHVEQKPPAAESSTKTTTVTKYIAADEEAGGARGMAPRANTDIGASMGEWNDEDDRSYALLTPNLKALIDQRYKHGERQGHVDTKRASK